MTGGDLADIARLELGGTRGSQGWIEWNRRNYVELGFGLWVVETNSGGFVGDCGLTMQEVEGEWLVEAGWHVRSDLRRQGYATGEDRPGAGTRGSQERRPRPGLRRHARSLS